ncbi:MAG: secretion protein HlyD [Planctomycetaceae bacterium]|jgi:HlyD family secretion protein|nr:secretion protein HlyD [Planctomycetaceae bacterium]
MFKRIVLMLFLAALAVGGSFAWQYYVRTQTAEQDGVLTLYGNVEIRRVNLGFRVAGRIAGILFEEGALIKKGELIAQLDKEPFDDLYAVAAAQRDNAKENYEKLKAGNRPQEIEQARAAVNERTATLKVLESDFERAAELVKDRTISEQEHETVKARRDEAVARKKLAEENLNLLIEGFRKEDIAAAKAKVSEAAANLKKTETSLKDTELRCPNDGTLLTRIEEIGSVVNAGQTVATLSLQDAVWVYVYVSERELGRIAPDMKAAIYTDTKPNEPYCGHIGYISPEAEFTPKNVETTELRTSLVYRVRVIADNPDHGLRQGMPVTVKVSSVR